MKQGMGAMVLVLALAVTGPACKDDVSGGNTDSPSDVVFPISDVSYSQHLQPLFNQTCALSGCHDDGQSQVVRLTSYGNVFFAQPQVIVEGEPESSVLVMKIEGRIGQRMPLNRNPLNQNQINGIRAWIAEGARNN